MAIAVTCPKCGKVYSVKDEAVGKTLPCPCGAFIVVPTADAPPPLPPPLRVVVVDVDIPLGSLCWLALKVALASACIGVLGWILCIVWLALAYVINR